MYQQESFSVATEGRGTYRIEDQIARFVETSGIATGLCHIFCHHTSASLILCENADPTVRRDLETFMARLAPDGDSMFQHDTEGPDDMPAHVRTILTQDGAYRANYRRPPEPGNVAGHFSVRASSRRSSPPNYCDGAWRVNSLYVLNIIFIIAALNLPLSLVNQNTRLLSAGGFKRKGRSSHMFH